MHCYYFIYCGFLILLCQVRHCVIQVESIFEREEHLSSDVPMPESKDEFSWSSMFPLCVCTISVACLFSLFFFHVDI